MLMFFKPNAIAHIDIAAAQPATFEMFGLAQWWSADLSPDHVATRSWFVDWHDRGHARAPSYVMQQLFRANARCDPRIEFLFCKYGLRIRIDVSQLPRKPPLLEVVIIDRVLAQCVRHARQRSAPRTADHDVVPSRDQRNDMLDRCPIIRARLRTSRAILRHLSWNTCSNRKVLSLHGENPLKKIRSRMLWT